MKTSGKLQAAPSYERSGLLHRFKDLSVLGLSSLAIAAISTLIMDLLVYPLSVFALSKTQAFTLIFKYSFLALVIAAIAFMIAKKIYMHRKNGLTFKETLRDIAKTPAIAAATFFFLVLVSIILIAAIYFLLSYNNRLINSLINS